MCNQPVKQIDMNCKVIEKGWGQTVGGWRCRVLAVHAGGNVDRGTTGWCLAG